VDWFHNIVVLLIIGIVCVVVTLDSWSIVVAARDILVTCSMVAVVFTHGGAIVLL